MDTLRWILLAVGALVIALIYFLGRRSRRDVVDEIAAADPVVALERNEPRVEIKRRVPEVKDMDRELTQLSNLIAEDRDGRAPLTTRSSGAAEKSATLTGSNTVPAKSAAVTAQPVQKASAAIKEHTAPVEEKLVILYVVAPPGGRFAGPDILRAAEAAGLSHGRMHIFHRLGDPARPDSDAVFSLTSMVEPGTFDLDALDDFSTPGLTLFMQLPGPLNGLTALDSLIAAARRIAAELHGELRDQSRSVLGKQTVEHLRTEIMEYQRRQRVAHAPT